MKRVEKEEVVVKIRESEELRELFADAKDTMLQANKLAGQMYGSRVYGNQTASVEAKVDFTYNYARLQLLYEIIRYDCIERINEIVGGNVVDMTGTDRQVCRRFMEAYGFLAA